MGRPHVWGGGTHGGVPKSLTPPVTSSSVVNYEGGAVCTHARSLWRLEPLRIRYGGTRGDTGGPEVSPPPQDTGDTVWGPPVEPQWGLGVLGCPDVLPWCHLPMSL